MQMEFVEISFHEKTAAVQLQHGKVIALNEDIVSELSEEPKSLNSNTVIFLIRSLVTE